jgi:hypothetical protein
MWDIIYVYHDKPVHLEHLQKSNSDNNILLCDISSYSLFVEKKYCWKNNDLLIRNWIRQNRSKITNENIALVEWDVVISQKLPDLKVKGLIGKNIQNYGSGWYWFCDSKKLGPIEKYRIGITPFALLFMDQQCIDYWIHYEFDPLYVCDIISELRLPSLLNSKNIPITTYPMPNMSATVTQFSNTPGMYHPVKQKISTSTT